MVPRHVHASLGMLLCVAACGPKLEHGASALRIDEPLTFHEREGFLPLVTPAHIPSGDPEIDQVTVWLRVGEGEITSEGELGSSSHPLRLRFPGGTRADRVESAGRGAQRRIVDIRGARVLEDGQAQRFFVLRPAAPRPDAPLFGAEWGAGEPAAQQSATAYLATKIGQSPPFDAMPAERRDAVIASFKSKNACLPCHAPSRADNRTVGEHGLVNRGTDLSGFFTPSTVFSDEIPLESYGRFDHTLDDPLVDIYCGDALMEPPRSRECSENLVPWARWNWSHAWTQDPPRAQARCEVAQSLSKRLDAATAAKVRPFLAHCRGNGEDSL